MVLDMTNQGTRTGEAIRTLRRLAGLTLEQASQLADTAPAYLSKVETGKLIPTRGYVANVVLALSLHLQTPSEAALNQKVEL